MISIADGINDRLELLTQCTLDRTVHFDTINATLSWSVVSKAAEIEFELIVPISNEQSWSAIGISDTGGMIGTDVGLFTWLNDQQMYDMYSQIMPMNLRNNPSS